MIFFHCQRFNNVAKCAFVKQKAAIRCGINSLDKGVEEKIKKRDYTYTIPQYIYL